jgi:ribokinase
LTSGPAVLSAGTVNADFVMGVDGRLERGASLIATDLLCTSGGRAGNVAVMARRLGTPARLFGCVGVDQLAEQALAGPRAAGVDLGGVRRVQAETGVVSILVDGDATKTMVFAPGANDAFSETDAERLALHLQQAPAGSVLVVDSEIPPTASTLALEAARDAGRPAVLDPTRPERVTDRLLGLADHVTPNADEAKRLTGVAVDSPADARRAAGRLRERGARHVHVRLPAGGCLTQWPGGEALFSAPTDWQVVDTTGAGDAFAGTLASSLISGCRLVEAVRRAVAAAACAVTRFGAQESYPDPRELEARTRTVRVEMAPGRRQTAR